MRTLKYYFKSTRRDEGASQVGILPCRQHREDTVCCISIDWISGAAVPLACLVEQAGTVQLALKLAHSQSELGERMRQQQP